jgi:hypothetical protein
MDVSCHRPFLPGTSLEPAVIPTAQASSLLLLLLLLTAIEVSLGVSSPYVSTDKTSKNKYT